MRSALRSNPGNKEMNAIQDKTGVVRCQYLGIPGTKFNCLWKLTCCGKSCTSGLFANLKEKCDRDEKKAVQ